MKFFKKTNPGNRLMDRGGKAIPFERLADGSIAILSLDEEKQERLIEDIEVYVTKGVGGVTAIKEI